MHTRKSVSLSRVLVVASSLLMFALQTDAAVGDACVDPVDHCGAPEKNTGCCYSNSKCYLKDDCASYIAGCAFTNDGEKGEGLACTPDQSPFKESKCAAGVKAAQGIPIDNPQVKCYQSDNLICNKYSNATFTHFTAQCKPGTVNAAETATSKLSVLAATLMAALLAALLRL